MRKLVVLGSVLVVALLALVAGIAIREPEVPAVGPVDPVCEQAVRERPPDLVFTRKDLQAPDDPAQDVTFWELRGRNREVVRVVGFLSAGDSWLLFESWDAATRICGDFRPRLRQHGRDAASRKRYAVVLNPGLFRSYGARLSQNPFVGDRCVRVTGFFRQDYHSFIGSAEQEEWLGHLGPLRAMEVWSEPHRPLPAPPPPEP
jgi:hypothetical protein